MTPDQIATAEVYQSIPLEKRLRIMEDLDAFADRTTDALVASGIRAAAARIMMQATRIDREKRRKNG